MNFGVFSLAILTSWAISPVLSGALLPTLGNTVQTVQGGFFRIHGATSNASGVLTDCYGRDAGPFPYVLYKLKDALLGPKLIHRALCRSCPAVTFGVDLVAAMTQAIDGGRPYYTGQHVFPGSTKTYPPHLILLQEVSFRMR
jgi:hypothetical protein